FSMQCSMRAISVANLYVAVRMPVSRIATTRWPLSHWSSGADVTDRPRCRPAQVQLHHRIMASTGENMGKLVRDKIPEFIRASGRTPHVSALSPSAYREALIDKLREEAAELQAAQTGEALLEEAADVLEVLAAIA